MVMYCHPLLLGETSQPNDSFSFFLSFFPSTPAQNGHCRCARFLVEDVKTNKNIAVLSLPVPKRSASFLFFIPLTNHGHDGSEFLSRIVVRYFSCLYAAYISLTDAVLYLGRFSLVFISLRA